MSRRDLTFCAATRTAAHRAAAVVIAGAVAACMLAMAPLSAMAQDLKIGYVNVDRLMRESLPARAIDARLAAEFSQREKDLDEQEARLKAAAEELDKVAPTLGEQERARRQRELIDQERNLMRTRREFNEQVALRRDEELAGLEVLAHRAIRQIFKEEKYDLILREAVLAGPNVDITDKAIKALATEASRAR
ncbi:OmpH family outer membrane protein [Acidovorax sp. sic0104]|uniref:OmpH family outer membrane protein n=1 Tax=Acidovorax sp. sic0104 TaxID=2854784 RepID=UPI001C449D70|nr:OmpH family outer membrane protein [Acidovorax sp. sic0104]MBV7542701.1 OmpH family outer membrane protein [Acidovorax sp. sic0104]